VMASLIELVIFVAINLLIVRIVFFRKQESKPEAESVSWKSAVDAMSIMEARLKQLQERDLKQQERIWSLEDMNRDLQTRLARVTKELALVIRQDNEANAGPAFDDDDDDINHSLPTG
jgi:hypothetical protein